MWAAEHAVGENRDQGVGVLRPVGAVESASAADAMSRGQHSIAPDDGIVGSYVRKFEAGLGFRRAKSPDICARPGRNADAAASDARYQRPYHGRLTRMAQ